MMRRGDGLLGYAIPLLRVIRLSFGERFCSNESLEYPTI